MRTKILKLKDILVIAIAKHPIEIFISVLFFIFNTARYFYQPNIKYDTNIAVFYLSAFAVSYAMNILFREQRKYYYLSILFSLLFVVLQQLYDDNITMYLNITACSVLFIFTAYRSKSNAQFAGNAIVTTSNILASGTLTFITTALLYSIVASVSYICGIDYRESMVLTFLSYVSIYIVLPLLFLVLSSRNNDIKKDRFSDILLNYILTPSLIIYGIILYGYFAKVIIFWELPKGVISTTAILFLLFGIIVKAYRTFADKKMIEWFFNYFSFIALPAVVMLWISIIYRVTEYGFTTNRIYLLTAIITLTMWNFAQMCKKTDVYQYLTIFTIIIFQIIAYIPTTYEKQQKDIDKEKQIFYISPESIDEIDIEGYTKLRYLRNYNYKSKDSNYFKFENDTIFFYAKNDSLLTTVSTKELTDQISQNAGINFDTITYKSRIDIGKKSKIFKNDNITFIIQQILVERNKDVARIKEIGIAQIMTK